MTDGRLAAVLQATTEFEREVRAYLVALHPNDLAERDAAQIASRQVTALRKPLESWLAARAMRSALAARK